MDAPIGKNTKRILSDPELTEQLMEILISRSAEEGDKVVQVDGKKVKFSNRFFTGKNGHNKK